MSKTKQNFIDRDFQKLAIQINQAIVDNDVDIKDKKAQKILVEKVMNYEKSLIRVLKKYARTQEVYAKFIQFITENENDGLGNILSARPYFREDQKDFTAHIAPAFRNKDAKRLMDFHANHMLLKYIMDNWGPDYPKQAMDIWDKFLENRNRLIENNLPLALNRAKTFYRKVPKNHLSLLDFIDICTHGLITGIDKYSGEWKPNWAGVCIGRMVGYMIEEYSQSLLRMYPTDRKILYRANSLKYRLKIDNIKVLTDAVNASFIADKKEGKTVPKLPITIDYLSELMNSSSTVSADTPTEDEEGFDGISLYDYSSDGEDTVGDMVEKQDLMNKVSSASSSLLLVERKIIKLKGVEL